MKNDAAYNEKMARLYREVILKEGPAASKDGFIPLDALQPKAKKSSEEVAEEVLGD